jgi:putative Mn2+ efflux pump MntP
MNWTWAIVIGSVLLACLGVSAVIVWLENRAEEASE